MATIIDKKNITTHSVDKYNFKVLSIHHRRTSDEQKDKTADTYTEENHPNARKSDIDSSALSSDSKDSLIESLLKKTDEMSSNFIKLQMKLEAKEEEYKESLQKEKKISYEEGVEAGKAQAKEEIKAEYENGLNQFGASIAKLQESAKKFETALENIKKELVGAALDIAKEVIGMQVSENSAEIAKILGEELIKELQSASKIKLKVNPKNHGALSQIAGTLENVEIVSDDAISEGGVVALSDAGNIDAQISKRFERVKKAALDGQ